MIQTIKSVFVLGLILSLAFSFSATAGADTLDDKYQALLNDPANLDNLYNYAQQAIKEGEFESAIAALESMLVISSDQPRVFLELGALYYRLGAQMIARTYINQSKKLVDGEEVNQIITLTEFYGAAIDRASGKDKLQGFVALGIRTQSNPAGAPEASEIFSRGKLYPDSREEKRDENLFFLSRILHRNEFKSGSAMVSDLTTYVTAYDENDQFDLAYFEGTTGYQFNPSIGKAREFSLRPHLVLRATWEDGKQLETTLGGGLDLNYGLSPKTHFSGLIQYRDLNFKDTGRVFDTSLRSGSESRLDLRLRSEVAHGQVVALRLLVRDIKAESKFLGFFQYQLGLRYIWLLDNKIFNTSRKISLAPHVLRRVRDFDVADINVNSLITRKDKEWRVGFYGLVPFTDTWSLQFSLEGIDINSSLPNNTLVNELASVAIRKDF